MIPSEIWKHITDLPLRALEKVIRPVVVYLAIVTLLRVFGKRQLAQLNPFDLTVLLCLSNTVQNAIIGEDNSVTGGLLGAVTLLGVNYLMVRFLFNTPGMEKLLAGEPTVLMEHGRIVRGALAREMLTAAELTIAAHRNGYSSLNEIDRCVLEPGGVMTFHPKQESLEARQRKEILARLERLADQLEGIERRMNRE